MKKNIQRIPSLIYGEKSDQLILAVHGSKSNKADVPVEILAEQAVKKGYQVLSFDLPGHGERPEGPCRVFDAMDDLQTVMRYASARWKRISLFANSIGAYFSLMAYRDEALERAYFLSPVVDMLRVIENMMRWFQVSEAQLQHDQVIPTPLGETLYWDYFCYVREHPVEKWDIPTDILYGGRDELCERDAIAGFAGRFSCGLRIAEQAEHYFHTPEDLRVLREWLGELL